MNELIIEELKTLIRRESYWIPVMSNAAALLYAAEEHIIWAGFYLIHELQDGRARELVLGPFQGKPAGARIRMNEGVCGRAAWKGITVCAQQTGEDPHAIPGVRSEIAVPLRNSAGEVIGVLNLDSSEEGRFGPEEQALIERFALEVEVGITGFEEEGYVKYRMALRNLRGGIEDPSVVYQGEPGAYSEAAAVQFFGESEKIRGLRSFEDAFRALKDGTADYAVLPIENSSTGVIRQVYDLLAQYECFMIGETTVKVDHSFMVLPGANLDEIDAVYSHEQGLFQCEEFLKEHPEWKQVPQEDTAGSARLIAEMKNPRKAAICSARAAVIYGLEVVKESVNSQSGNTTRFVVIAPQMEIRDGSDKICISFMTPHKPGALHEVLTIFTVRGLNLVRLESRPIPEHNWEYMFFVEFTGNLRSPGMDDVIRELADATEQLRVYGNFCSNL